MNPDNELFDFFRSSDASREDSVDEFDEKNWPLVSEEWKANLRKLAPFENSELREKSEVLSGCPSWIKKDLDW